MTTENKATHPLESGSAQSGPEARRLARQVLGRVAKGAYATLALRGELQRSPLHPRARALAAELVYGTLKQRRRIDRALRAFAPKGLAGLDEETLEALRLGVYQMLFMRTPPHAVVSDAVEAVKRGRGARLSGFVNALLRRLQREGEPALPAEDDDRPASLGERYSLPDALVEDALARLPRAEVRAYLAALNEPAPLWLRLNLLKGDAAALRARLTAADPDADLPPSPRVPQLEEALRASGSELLTSPAYGAGWFTVQDLGAQLVSRLVFASAPPLAGPLLDACAGVGGKATHLCALSGAAVPIDAADASATKLELLRDHAHRLGCAPVTPHQLDLTNAAQVGARLRPGYAAVLLDAPCSGLGVLRRHPEARWRPLPDRAELAALQRRMLDALAPRVLPGGRLVYSVCTYSEEEGPAQTAAFLARHPEFRLDPPAAEDPIFGAGLIDQGGALRTWPHREDADGFYAVRLQRLTSLKP